MTTKGLLRTNKAINILNRANVNHKMQIADSCVRTFELSPCSLGGAVIAISPFKGVIDRVKDTKE